MLVLGNTFHWLLFDWLTATWCTISKQRWARMSTVVGISCSFKTYHLPPYTFLDRYLLMFMHPNTLIIRSSFLPDFFSPWHSNHLCSSTTLHSLGGLDNLAPGMSSSRRLIIFIDRRCWHYDLSCYMLYSTILS